MAASYEISKAAEKDWRGIVRYTLDNFGKRQVQKYTNGLLKCLDDLGGLIGNEIMGIVLIRSLKAKRENLPMKTNRLRKCPLCYS